MNQHNDNNSPQFTRRHYIWLASAMRDVLLKAVYEQPIDGTLKDGDNYPIIESAIENFAAALSSENPNFDKERFLNNVFCTNLTNNSDAA